MNQEHQQGLTSLPVSPPEGIPTVSSLEIAKITGKRHTNVLRDIKAIFQQAEIGGLEFERSYLSPQNKELPCFHLPRRECDLIMTAYSAKYRIKVIDRWHALEAAQEKSPPQSYIEALEAHLASQKLIQAQEALALENQPKVEFYDTVTASESVCQLAVAAQLADLGYGRNILFKRLREANILITDGHRHNLPKQRYVQQGLFTVKEKAYRHPVSGEPVVSYTTHVTQKGLDFLIRDFRDSGASRLD